MLREVHGIHIRIFACTHEKCLMWTWNIQFVMIHFIMLHDNISSTHEQYFTWHETFCMYHDTLYSSCHMISIMSHDNYHVTWYLSCNGMISCHMIIIMSHEKKITRINQRSCVHDFSICLGELSCVHEKFIMFSKGIFFWWFFSSRACVRCSS